MPARPRPPTPFRSPLRREPARCAAPAPHAAAAARRLPASGDPQVLAAQTTMVEAWSIVREAFVDDKFGGHNWVRALARAWPARQPSPARPGGRPGLARLLRCATVHTRVHAAHTKNPPAPRPPPPRRRPQEDELRAHMVAAYNSNDPAAAWQEIGAMLSDLGDPYTRIMPAE
jgi:hypothetical protein